ncbi:hypothetical protein FPV67DRAFT_1676929 [Lyophyllum atratum]|nr:hypothetical protein FPV67DRAFT_1676929 [Lyophyllum atratum]
MDSNGLHPVEVVSEDGNILSNETKHDNVDEKSVDAQRAGQKRPRIEDVRRFLSLEAEVDDESEEDDDDEELDDFLEDQEPVVADSRVSHRLLYREHTRASAEGNWVSFLTRAHERAHHNKHDNKHDYVDDESLLDVPRPQLWRVAVKPGYEETAAFILMAKIIRGGCRWAVKSIVGEVSHPGWIVIEATTVSDVESACQEVSNVYPQRMHVIAPEDVSVWIKKPTLFTPRNQSWVRLSRHPYQGDLAYVREFNTGGGTYGADVLVVPRLRLERRLTRRVKRPRSSRPDQALFDEKKVIEVWGEKSVERRNQVLLFKGAVYVDGYLSFVTNDFYPEEAIPTSDEIALFRNARCIPRDVFQRTLEMMTRRQLVLGDSVIVANGESQGVFGVVESLTGNEAVIRTVPDKLQLAVSIDSLRKDFRVGDQVKVTIGTLSGSTGWVVAVTPEMLTLYDHKAKKHMQVPYNCVQFFELPFITHSGESSHHNSRLEFPKDPRRHLVGRHVRVMRNHQLKAYEAIIKSTLEGNNVLIEVQATMRQERISLSHLTLINDSHFTPLSIEEMTRRQSILSGMVIPQSTLPLVPSTPLPPGTSVAFSPAWDPSSRTPSANSSFPYSPWMESPLFTGKRIKVQINDTKAVLRDPGFKTGITRTNGDCGSGLKAIKLKF